MSVLNGHLYTFKEKCKKIEKSMLNLAGARKIKKEWKKREQKTKKSEKSLADTYSHLTDTSVIKKKNVI